MAGEEKSFFTAPPHFGQCAYGGSEARCRISVRSPQRVHWYSKRGMRVRSTLMKACFMPNVGRASARRTSVHCGDPGVRVLLGHQQVAVAEIDSGDAAVDLAVVPG